MSGASVAILGLWHQGVVAAACLADLGNNVVATDPNAHVVADLNAGRAPVFEPGLDELVAKGIAAGRLRFVDGYAKAVKDAEFVCIMLDTPVDEQDRSDLTGILTCAEAIAPHLDFNAVVYVTAQVPIGTCARLSEILDAGAKRHVPIAYTPENLRLGLAIERFLKPDLPVIGTEDDIAFEKLTEFLAPLSSDWQRTNIASAEMLKHALNGFLAVSICFANELGNLCDEVGADGRRIAQLLRMEPRIGPKAMLTPGLGFSGGTLARDMISLRTLGDRTGVETQLLDGAWVSNLGQNKLVVRRLREMLGDLSGRRICVLGLTYKPNTSTLRRSAALEVVTDLTAAGALVRANDPAADRQELARLSGFEFLENPYEAAVDADAVVLMTPWQQYKDVDFGQFAARMRGKIVFDTARLWSPAPANTHGLTYLDIGGGRRPDTA